MWSNCCGSEPSYLSDELCGSCLDHAEFDDEDEEDENEIFFWDINEWPMGETCRNGKEWNKCDCC